jgi:hypothetical protein
LPVEMQWDGRRERVQPLNLRLPPLLSKVCCIDRGCGAVNSGLI